MTLTLKECIIIWNTILTRRQHTQRENGEICKYCITFPHLSTAAGIWPICDVEIRGFLFRSRNVVKLWKISNEEPIWNISWDGQAKVVEGPEGRIFRGFSDDGALLPTFLSLPQTFQGFQQFQHLRGFLKLAKCEIKVYQEKSLQSCDYFEKWEIEQLCMF